MVGIANVLDHFGAGGGGLKNGPRHPGIEFLEAGQVGGMVGADYGEWGLKEILDCRAFAQKFGIETDAEINARALAAVLLENRSDYIIGGPGQNRAAEDNPVVIGF